jgi:uncharacterized SAM-binding protein YcdF (DUF218 family)
MLKKWLKRALKLFSVLLVLWLVFMCGFMTFLHVWGLNATTTEKADVIIILGAGTDPQGNPGPALLRRINWAVDLYNQGLAPALLCTGGMPTTRPRSEAAACQEALERAGVPTEAIFIEDKSRSTEENALFSQPIMQANAWQKAIVVSDNFHVFRANWLFSRLGMNVTVSAVPPSGNSYLVLLGRDAIAFQWQILKDIFNLPFTYVPVI